MNRIYIILCVLLLAITALIVVGGLYCPDYHRLKRTCGLYAETQKRIGDLIVELDFYEAENGNYPDHLDDLITHKLSTNIMQVSYTSNEIPKDAWGEEFYYHRQSNDNSHPYSLSSSGADRKHNTSDDVE